MRVGGVIDDLILYRSGDQEYFLVINAACRDIDLAWMRGRLPADVSVVLRDLGDAYAAIALQGPDSEKVLQRSRSSDPRSRSVTGSPPFPGFDGEVPPLVARTGYTGEDGFELFVPVVKGEALWNALLAAGVKPCGLGPATRSVWRWVSPAMDPTFPGNGRRSRRDSGNVVLLDDSDKPQFTGRAGSGGPASLRAFPRS